MSNTLVGKDLTAYSVTGLGFSNLAGGSSNTGTYSLMGSWKDVEITVSYNWVDRTPSSGDWETKRRTTRTFKGSAKNMVTSGGSASMITALTGDQILLIFTTIDGQTCTCFAGISEGGITGGKEGVDDSLNFECIGQYNGGDPISFDNV